MKRPGAEPEGAAARFEQAIAAFANDRKRAPIAKSLLAERAKPRRRTFGSDALKVDGRMFAMVVKGRFVATLPRDRVSDLVNRGDAE